MKKINLSTKMTQAEFDNGYWYSVEIKLFAKQIGIKSSSKLRKDELEELIRHFLRTGNVKQSSRKLDISTRKDSDSPIKIDQKIINYTNNKETKDFIEVEAHKTDQNFKRKSGSRYRLNRWREDQMNKGNNITYADLINEYVKLNKVEGSYKQVPVGRYINFIADFLSNNPNSKRETAILAWKELKTLDIAKTYDAWLKKK